MPRPMSRRLPGVGPAAWPRTYGCDVIKKLGDAVMIHGEDATRVVALALRLRRELAAEGDCPPLKQILN